MVKWLEGRLWKQVELASNDLPQITNCDLTKVAKPQHVVGIKLYLPQRALLQCLVCITSAQ